MTQAAEIPRERVRVVISGRVQGVWYRGWTVDEARARGLDGWVRNRRDGTVEAVFQGQATAVAEMVAACHQGPPLARVVAVETHPHDDPVAPGFAQAPSMR
jgi:acylphosphatase